MYMNQTEIIGIAGAGLVIVAIIGLKYGTNNNTNKNKWLDFVLEDQKNHAESDLAKNKRITDLEFLENLEEQKKKERDAINEEYERQINILKARITSVSHYKLNTTKKLKKPDYKKEAYERRDMKSEDSNANTGRGRGRGKKHRTKKKRGKKK